MGSAVKELTETSFLLEGWPQAATISTATDIRTILFMAMGFYLANLLKIRRMRKSIRRNLFLQPL